MKKGFFCDEVLRLLSSGAYSVSEFKFERRDVAAQINGGIAQVIKLNFWENYKLGDPGWIDAGFLTTFEDVPVLYKTSRKLYYSDLPTLPISLQGGLGLVEVAPMEDERSAFIPQGAGDAGLYKGLPAEDLFGSVGYRQQGKQIYYQNMSREHCACETGVLIVMAASTLHLSMDDELPMPDDYYLQIQDQVINLMLKGMTKQDTTIDANPSTR